MVTVGINGFGRTGRNCMLVCLEKDVEVKHVNDPFISTDYMIYLFKYDSNHGVYKEPIYCQDNSILINEKKITTSHEKDPSKIPWHDAGVQYVIEATGVFTDLDKAKMHLLGGAKFVIITAPSIDAPTFIYGVNHEEYEPERYGRCLSASSDTTNCAAPIIKLMHENFGVEEAMITTIHAVTADQKTVDGPTGKLWRHGRSAMQNIIPSPTSAAKCIGRVIPDLKGKVQAIGFRVPVANVSVCDITIRMTEGTTLEAMKHAMRTAANGQLKNVLNYTEDDCVSSDFLNTPYSCTFDALATIPHTETFVKIIAWYDNEYGYANRVIDLICHMSTLASVENIPDIVVEEKSVQDEQGTSKSLKSGVEHRSSKGSKDSTRLSTASKERRASAKENDKSIRSSREERKSSKSFKENDKSIKSVKEDARSSKTDRRSSKNGKPSKPGENRYPFSAT